MSQAEIGNSVLGRLLAAVSDVLGRDVSDASVSFQDLDGDSLSAIIVTEILREQNIGLGAEELLSARPLHEVADIAKAAG